MALAMAAARVFTPAPRHATPHPMVGEGKLTVRWADDDRDRAAAREVRRRVFVVGLGIPQELEVDAHEPECRHLLATLDGKPVGAARLRGTAAGSKLERVAVDAAHRGRGVGRALVRYTLAELPPDEPVYVHAQQAAMAFWRRLGFEPEGAAFVEAGIRHRTMHLQNRLRPRPT